MVVETRILAFSNCLVLRFRVLSFIAKEKVRFVGLASQVCGHLLQDQQFAARVCGFVSCRASWAKEAIHTSLPRTLCCGFSEDKAKKKLNGNFPRCHDPERSCNRICTFAYMAASCSWHRIESENNWNSCGWCTVSTCICHSHVARLVNGLVQDLVKHKMVSTPFYLFLTVSW